MSINDIDQSTFWSKSLKFVDVYSSKTTLRTVTVIIAEVQCSKRSVTAFDQINLIPSVNVQNNRDGVSQRQRL